MNEDAGNWYNGTDPSGQGVTFAWDFAGAIIDGQDINFTFATPGSKTVIFWADDGAGGNVSDTITVTVLDLTPPSASAGVDQNVNEDVSVSLSASGSSDNDPNFGVTGRYYWTFSDNGASISLTGVSTSYTFATPGVYTVNLIVLDAGGNFASDFLVVTVKDITAPTIVIVGGAAQTFDEDSLKSLDAAGTADNDPTFISNGRFYWTFTDVTPRNLSGKTTSYTFATPGSYVITLTVMDNTGNLGTATSTFTVSDITNPVAAWTLTSPFNEDVLQTLNGASSTDNVLVTNYTWSVEDTAGTTTLYGSSVSYTWNTPRSFNVTLTVRDAAGNSNALLRLLSVRDTTAPTGTGFVPGARNEDTVVQFSSPNITDNDPAFNNPSYPPGRRDYWTFTDGSLRNLTGTFVNYTFATPGSFAITLLVMDAAGNRLSLAFTIVIADTTPPAPVIAAASLNQNREQFAVDSFSGTTSDNVAVSASWWLFNNGSAQNRSGTSFTAVFSTPGTYLITFQSRDAVFNIGSAFTNITIYTDATPPSITWGLNQPDTGDDTQTLTYYANATDNNPACSASCNWTWSKDGVATGYTLNSFSTVWTYGVHTLRLTVRDPAGNSSFVQRTVVIDQLISVSTTWPGNQSLDWNLRITNGATFTIRGMTMWASSSIVTINVTNGTLLVENSNLVANSSAVGFKIYGTGALGGRTFLYFNDSTVNGLYNWITVWGGTLSARNTVFSNPRLDGTGLIRGYDANLYLTQVTLNSVTTWDGRGVQANFGVGVTVFQTREVILQQVTATNINNAPFVVNANGMVGTLNVTLRDSRFQTNEMFDSNVHGLYFYVTGVNNGDFNFRMLNVTASDNPNGGLYGLVSSATTGRVRWNITDSVFGRSGYEPYGIWADGMHFATRASSINQTWNFLNVSSRQNYGNGLGFYHENGGKIQDGVVRMEQMWLDNNTGDGILSYQYTFLTTWTWLLKDSDLSSNQNGINVDWHDAWGSRLNAVIDPTLVNYNSQSGINVNLDYNVVNVTFDIFDSQFIRNGVAGFAMRSDFYQYPYLGPRTWFGDLVLNLTRVTATNNGNALYLYTRNSNLNFSGNWIDSSLDRSVGDGVVFEGYADYFYNGVTTSGSWQNVTLHTDRTSISHSGGNGFYITDQMSGYQGCCWVTAGGIIKYQLFLNNSHVDWNGARGVYRNTNTNSAASHLTWWLSGGTTVERNAGSGFWQYVYTYTQPGFGAQPVSTSQIINAIDSSISWNGYLAPDTYGVNLETFYGYGLEQATINFTNVSVNNNAGTGLRLYNYFCYQATSLGVNIVNSSISGNGAKGFHSYYYYAYNTNVKEQIINTTLSRNGAEPYFEEYPESYARSGTPWTVQLINNTIDRASTTAISNGVSYAYPYQGMGGPEVFNFSGNRITNVSGAAINWKFSPPSPSQSITVDFWGNYIADTQDGVSIAPKGETSTVHRWNANFNTFERTQGNALILSIPNTGGGNSGTLTFVGNVFRQTGGTAFTLTLQNVKLASLLIKDCVFDTQRVGLELAGIVGVVDNATFVGSIKFDISLSDGLLEIHNTVVNPDKLKPVGGAAAFNVFFDLKVFVVWAGTGKPVAGAVAQYSDATGSIFYIGTVADASGLPSLELWSYTKTIQGVLGRTPFTVDVTYFEIEQAELIDLYQDRVVTINLADTVLPTLVISNPKDGFGTQGSTIRVDGTVYDSQSGFAFDINDPQLPGQYVEVSSDNTTWSTVHVKSSSAFEVQFDFTFTGLQESVDTLYVRVHDDANNYWTREIPVRIDHTAPVVRILQPLSSSIVTNANTLHLSAETEIGALIFVNGLVPPEVFTRPDLIHVFFEMDLPIFEGPNTVTVVAIDSLNNQGNASIFVLVDRQPPYLAVIDPKVDALVNSTTVSVLGQTERTGVTVLVNGALATIDPTGNFTKTVTLTSDFNRIEILATDTAGNTQLVVREVRFDNVPPWINVQSPASNALINSPEVDVIGIVEPGAKLIVNDELVSAPTGAFSRRILLTEGSNGIQFVAIDPAGNYGYRTVFVTVDTVRPTIDITAPANESLVNKTSVLISGSVADEHTPTLFVNGQEIAVNTDGTFQVAASLFEGTNFVTLESRDGAGNSNIKVLTLIRDTTAPFLVSGLEGVFFEGVALKTYNRSVTVVGFTERGAILEVCYTNTAGAQVCNPIPLAADGGFRTFVELRAEVSNTMTVTSTDAAGNSITRSFQVIQAPQPAAPIEPPNYGLYALYGLGAAILLGSFFLLYMRRGKDDSQVELAGAEPGYMAAAPVAMEQPPQGEPVMGAPEYAVPMGGDLGEPAVTTAPEEPAAPESEASMAPEDGAVPAAPSRARPMRRRPAGGEGGGEAGSSALTGMGAEEEAKPGDTHQDEQ